MLVSHSHKFIFTKTFKTAGTSIEHYFEKYCLPDHMLTSGSKDEEVVSEAGIVGKRGAAEGHRWYAHMSAAQIREQLPVKQWSTYTKFSIVRNPFDKMVSAYFFLLRLKETQGTLTRLKNSAKTLLGKNDTLLPGNNPDHIMNFRKWIKAGAHFKDDSAYQINDAFILDYTMQYEYLHQHLQELCGILSIPYQPDRLKSLKSGYRPAAFSMEELYDEECISLVSKRHSALIEEFQYTFPG